MAAASFNTASIPGIEAAPVCIKYPATSRDLTENEFVDAGTSSKDSPLTIRMKLDLVKRSYLDIFMGGCILGSEWGQIPARPSIITPLEELERLVDTIEHKFINTEYGHPEIISRERYLLITSRQIFHKKVSCKEGLQVKPRKISQKEAYELAQKTRDSFKQKWKAYAQEEARRLYLFEGDED